MAAWHPHDGTFDSSSVGGVHILSPHSQFPCTIHTRDFGELLSLKVCYEMDVICFRCPPWPCSGQADIDRFLQLRLQYVFSLRVEIENYVVNQFNVLKSATPRWVPQWLCEQSGLITDPFPAYLTDPLHENWDGLPEDNTGSVWVTTTTLYPEMSHHPKMLFKGNHFHTHFLRGNILL